MPAARHRWRSEHSCTRDGEGPLAAHTNPHGEEVTFWIPPTCSVNRVFREGLFDFCRAHPLAFKAGRRGQMPPVGNAERS